MKELKYIQDPEGDHVEVDVEDYDSEKARFFKTGKRMTLPFTFWQQSADKTFKALEECGMNPIKVKEIYE